MTPASKRTLIYNEIEPYDYEISDGLVTLHCGVDDCASDLREHQIMRLKEIVHSVNRAEMVEETIQLLIDIKSVLGIHENNFDVGDMGMVKKIDDLLRRLSESEASHD